MSYRLRCNLCSHVYTSTIPYGECPRKHSYQSTSILEEVLDVAVDVAAAYIMADVASSVVDVAGSFLGSIFD